MSSSASTVLSSASTLITDDVRAVKIGPRSQIRREKAPPVEPFTGDKADQLWEDWLLTLERAGTWYLYRWEEDEKLLQLAGHLCGKAQRERDLLEPSSKQSYESAVKALGEKLNFDGKTVAAQDFRHMSQQARETVSKFIDRLEKTFRKAYGHENITADTRNTLLYGQLHEGLRYNLLKASAVSGASNYTQLSVDARNEEGRQTKLARRQHYQQDGSKISRREVTKHPEASGRPKGVGNTPNITQSPSQGWQPRCWNCSQSGHLAKGCPAIKRESTGSVMVTD